LSPLAVALASPVPANAVSLLWGMWRPRPPPGQRGEDGSLA